MTLLRKALLVAIMVLTVLILPLPSSRASLCGACWELKGITVELDDATTITGYTRWNDGEDAVGHKYEFPEGLLAIARETHQTLDVYTDLEKVPYPFKGAIVTTKEPLRLPIEKVIRVTAKPSLNDGYQGAGAIPLVSSEIAKLLQSKPHASCKGDAGGVTVVYWLSYAEFISQKDIEWLCKEPWTELIENSNVLQENHILRLDFPYD